MINVNKVPEYSTKLFTQIWDNYNDFETEWESSPFVEDEAVAILEERMPILFYLLYARFGNNPIANMDENQWKFKMFSVIYQYGPTWAKRLDIQQELRTMTEDDLRLASKAIYNHAFNPSSAPSTQSLEELLYINDQNTSNSKRGRLDAYAFLWDLLDVDVTEEFLIKFKPCFKQFVLNERPLLYITDEEDSE